MSRIRKHKLTLLFGILPLVLTSCAPMSNRNDINDGVEPQTHDGEHDSINDFVMLCGEGAPLVSAGSLHDIYVDTEMYDYYVKSSNGWVLCGNIQTEQGNGHTGVLPSIFESRSLPNDAMGKEGDLCIIYADGNVVYYIKTSSGWVLKGNVPETQPNPLTNEEVSFWSCYDNKTTESLNNVIEEIGSSVDYEINHTSLGSLDAIKKEMVNTIATGRYPNLVLGSPSHFAQYHASRVLEALDDYMDGETLSDYYPAYMVENYFYDKDATKHLYGLPFGKSSEFLYYNQVFVEYCDWKNPGHDLLNIPSTWDEWSDCADSSSKVSLYKSEFADLINNHRVVYATQDQSGHAFDFVYSTEPVEGKTKVFDYSSLTDSDNANLFIWKSMDNAFITLLRQWGSQYVVMTEDQYSLAPKKRAGTVLFANNENINKTIDMLKYVNTLKKQGTFGETNMTVKTAFDKGLTMFGVLSSAGIANCDVDWKARLSVAPIPYKNESHKYVMVEGSNICLTTNENNKTEAFDLMNKLTRSQYQAEWAKETGYLPVSKSAFYSSTYQSFINGTSYENKAEVYKRESVKTFVDYKDWIQFNEVPFLASEIVRKAIANIMHNVLSEISEADIDQDERYFNIIRSVLSQPEISHSININVELADY